MLWHLCLHELFEASMQAYSNFCVGESLPTQHNTHPGLRLAWLPGQRLLPSGTAAVHCICRAAPRVGAAAACA